MRRLPHYFQPTDERQRQTLTVKKTLLVYWYTDYKLCRGCASMADYGPTHFPPKKSFTWYGSPHLAGVDRQGLSGVITRRSAVFLRQPPCPQEGWKGVQSLQAFSAYWWCCSEVFLRWTECPQEERKGVWSLQPFSAYWWSRSAVFLRRTVQWPQCPQEKWRVGGSSINRALGAQGVGSLQAFSAYWWCRL